MTDVYWTDLQPLKDIIDELEPPNTVVNNKDIDDFKESVCYIIDEIIINNIEMYSDKHFDELLFESPNSEIDIIKNKIPEIMTSSHKKFIYLKVPIKVDIGVGNSWDDAH